MMLYNFIFKKIKLYNIKSIILFKDYKNYPPLGPAMVGGIMGVFTFVRPGVRSKKNKKIWELIWKKNDHGFFLRFFSTVVIYPVLIIHPCYDRTRKYFVGIPRSYDRTNNWYDRILNLWSGFTTTGLGREGNINNVCAQNFFFFRVHPVVRRLTCSTFGAAARVK